MKLLSKYLFTRRHKYLLHLRSDGSSELFIFDFREKPDKTTIQTTTSFINSSKEPDEAINYKNVVMALYAPVTKSGPCKVLDGTRKQNHQCRRDSGLSEALREAKRLAMTHCEEQFKYDRWNCSIEARGKRNIFKKVRLPQAKAFQKDSNKYIP